MKWAARLLGLVVALPGVSRAAETSPAPPLTLEWTAPAGCADRTRVLADVARILARSPASERRISAQVSVQPGDHGGWSIEIVTETGGTRRPRAFDAESCEAAEEAIALILALAVDPTAPSPPPENVPTPAPPPLSPALVPAASLVPGAAGVASETTPDHAPSDAPFSLASPDATAPRERASSARKRGLLGVASLGVTVATVADLGLLPRPAFGAELAVAARAGHLSVELAGADWATQRATASSGRAGADFHLWSMGVRAMYAWPTGRFTLGPFVDVGAGYVHAGGFGGTESSFTQNAFVPTVGAGGFLGCNVIGPLWLRLAVAGGVTLSRPSFVVIEPAPAPSSLVYRPSSFDGNALFAAELHFR